MKSSKLRITEFTLLTIIPGDPNKAPHDCLEELQTVLGGLGCTLCGAQFVPEHGSQLAHLDSAVERVMAGGR